MSLLHCTALWGCSTEVLLNAIGVEQCASNCTGCMPCSGCTPSTPPPPARPAVMLLALGGRSKHNWIWSHVGMSIPPLSSSLCVRITLQQLDPQPLTSALGGTGGKPLGCCEALSTFCALCVVGGGPLTTLTSGASAVFGVGDASPCARCKLAMSAWPVCHSIRSDQCANVLVR